MFNNRKKISVKIAFNHNRTLNVAITLQEMEFFVHFATQQKRPNIVIGF